MKIYITQIRSKKIAKPYNSKMMKKILIKIFTCTLAICFIMDLQAQNVGINNTTPNAPLSLANITGNKVDLFYNSATSRYGFGVQGSLLQMYTNAAASDIAFGFGSSTSFSELMRIKGIGTVGIGNNSPDDAGLVVDKKVGAVNAMFGRNTTGVAIESNFPGIGFNSYYNAGRKTISTGYTGLATFDPAAGNFIIYNSNLSTATDASATLFSRFLIDKDGDIGIEGNINPHAPLSFASTTGSKISLYGSTATSNYGLGIQGSLMQLYTNLSSSDMAFGYGGSTAFTENLRIKGNGNVGIGETNPTAKLHIFYNSSVASPHLRIMENDNTGPARIYLGNTAQANVFWRITGLNSTAGIFSDKLSLGHSSTSVGENGDLLTLTGASNIGISNTAPAAPLSFKNAIGSKIDLFYNSINSRYGFGIQSGLFQMFSDGVNSDIVFGYGSSTAFTERMRIKGNGNVGIGNNDPAFPLDVNGRMRLRYTAGNVAGLWFNKSDNTQGNFIGQYDTNNFGIFGPGASGSWKFLVDGNDGVVRIGTFQKATGYLVNIGGKLIAEEVRVQLQSTWPDYVFKNEYHLMPLAELEHYIHTNNHLPGFEKAEVVEKEGTDLGETQRKLVEKVEELTLYVIELKKEIDQLKNK